MNDLAKQRSTCRRDRCRELQTLEHLKNVPTDGAGTPASCATCLDDPAANAAAHGTMDRSVQRPSTPL